MDSPRPKRRAAKVDYTEKKPEEFEKRERELQKELQREHQRELKEREKEKKKSTTPEEQPALLNSQPVLNGEEYKFPVVLDLEGAVVRDGLILELSNGETLRKDDNVFLICEPPGDPYYVARIMGFVRKQGESSGTHPASEFQFKVNWWYRSRDISKHAQDSRVLYASMHSDTCPLQSFRGRCVVKHADEISDMEQYKEQPSHFWFERLFDRYMIKFYDAMPTELLLNLPENYKTALQKRFQYVFVEQGSKDMLQSPKSCTQCSQWCSPADSVQCCECDEWYHLLCLDPPIYKKPARGFVWSCIKCVKKIEERKMIPMEMPIYDAEEKVQPSKLPVYEELAISFLEKDKSLSLQQRRDKEEWIYRYLGIHARLEDALDLEDRPYPRAASRLGPRHQHTGLQPWLDHKVEYYDASELGEEVQVQKKKKDKKKKVKEEVEIQPVLPLPEEYKDVAPDDFPPWLQSRPEGYIERGGDKTATLMWKQPPDGSGLEAYIQECSSIAVSLGVLPSTPNFIDATLKNLMDCQYNTEKAMVLNNELTRQTLKEPTFTALEIAKFEAGIAKYGSELYPTFKEVQSQDFSMIVRFYYLWKKTPNGHLIWDNFEGRKKYKAPVQEQQENLSNALDDSSYDTEKSHSRKFECKHCHTEQSGRWFRSYGAQHGDTLTALCQRCARLWRRYAVVWESPTEVMRKLAIKGGSNWKRKLESELVMDAQLIMKMEPKKRKVELKKSPTPEAPKKPKREEAPVVLELPEVIPVTNESGHRHLVELLYLYTSPLQNGKLKWKDPVKITSSARCKPVNTPCALCTQPGDLLHCQQCRMSVHACCYGVDDVKDAAGTYKWCCDACSNTLNPVCSTDYNCIFCHKTGVVKRTDTGKWAHILCSLFVPGVRYGPSLQPISGYEKFILSQLEAEKYDFHINCGECDEPVTDGGVYGFALVKSEHKSVKHGSDSGRLEPVAYCSKHNDKSVIPFSAEVKRTKGNIAALRVFADDRRDPHTGAQSKFHHLNTEHMEEQTSSTPQHKCIQCQRETTLRWTRMENGFLCYTCKISDNDVDMDSVASELDFEEIDGSVYGIYALPQLHTFTTDMRDRMSIGSILG